MHKPQTVSTILGILLCIVGARELSQEDSDIEVVNVQVVKKPKTISPMDYVFSELCTAEGFDQVCSVNSLEIKLREHGMNPDLARKMLFRRTPSGLMNKTQFAEIFEQCNIQIGANGHIET